MARTCVARTCMASFKMQAKKAPRLSDRVLLVYAEEIGLKSSRVGIGTAFRQLDLTNICRLSVLYGNG